MKYGALRDLRDYWAECKTLKMDPSDDTIRWPKCLAKAHTETSKRIKYIEDKKHDEQIQRNLAELKAYFLENTAWAATQKAMRMEIQSYVLSERKIIRICHFTPWNLTQRAR